VSAGGYLASRLSRARPRHAGEQVRPQSARSWAARPYSAQPYNY
jgi:hypothetical protein